MFTCTIPNTSNWLQHKEHDCSIATRPVIVRLSFGSRSLLVRSSFVSRSSLVRYSLVYRRPIENRTRNKRKTNERATNVGRETIENSTSSHSHGWLMAGKVPFCNHKPTQCLSPKSAEANPCTSSPHWTFPWRIKPFCSSRRSL